MTGYRQSKSWIVMGLNAIAHEHASTPGEMWLCATKEYQFDVLESPN
jgi:hypothetical protein